MINLHLSQRITGPLLLFEYIVESERLFLQYEHFCMSVSFLPLFDISIIRLDFSFLVLDLVFAFLFVLSL